MLFEEDEEGKLDNISILRHFMIKLTKKHGKDQLDQMIPQQHRKMLTHTLKLENREKKKKKELKLARMKQWQEENDRKHKDDSSEYESGEEVEHKEEAMDIEEPLEELDNTNNLLLKYDLDKEQFHFKPELRGKQIVEKRPAANTDEITFDNNGIMIIEERKRARNFNNEEEGEPAQKIPDQPLNFRKKPKRSYLFI